MGNEYQDQDVWFELYELHPEASHVFRRQGFIKDFDTWEEAEAYASAHFKEGEEYRIKRACGLSE